MKKEINPSSKRKKTVSKKRTKNKEKFPIVGIGASAGGLESMTSFFENIPYDSGFAYIVVQHIDPDHECLLTEILQRTTRMRVYESGENMDVKPNCVYIIPPNRDLSILDGRLHLFKPLTKRGIRLPIDFFLKSLAEDQGAYAAGIILSGMGSDGSIGLNAIKENGGLAMIESPESAKFDMMPRNAIKCVSPDYIDSPGKLPEKLISYYRNFNEFSPTNALTIKENTSMEKILVLIRIHTSNDFLLYKKGTLYRRIQKRMLVLGLNDMEDYISLLRAEPDECKRLLNELLIGVTSFFRDPQLWTELKEKILPRILQTYPLGYQIRVWVPGCSTGEEAYSLAMVFREAIESMKEAKELTLQIFATDLDQKAIEKARTGLFTEKIISDVSPERLNRFFTKTEGGYRINSSIREQVIFANHNVVKDSPFIKQDLISCRNLMIYLEPELQKKLLGIFNYSLRENGILILGNAETRESNSSLFKDLNLRLRIFKRSNNPAPLDLINIPKMIVRIPPVLGKRKASDMNPPDLKYSIDQVLLDGYTPPSLLVDTKGEIRFLTGHLGRYIQPPQGKAQMNLFEMAREGLRGRLRKGFNEVLKSKKSKELRNIRIGNKEQSFQVDITIQWLEKPQNLKDLILIIFKDIQESEKKSTPKKVTWDATMQEKELEMEISIIKDELKLSYLEMQNSKEELNSTNEELQSTNEELMSTNEELFTSKEEMQSLNEELHTLNRELQSKVDDYFQINNDLKNLLNSTKIAILFLDKQLRIRRFTDEMTNVFKIRKGDLGRPFTDIATDLRYPELEKDAKHVLRTLIPSKKDIKTGDGRLITVSIIPYKTIEDRIDGLVMTFTDLKNPQNNIEAPSTTIKGDTSRKRKK